MFNFSNNNNEIINAVPIAAIMIMNFCALTLLLNNFSIASNINDPIIPYQNTVRYRERVESVMGGAHNVDAFYRLFLAPGVEHCSGGAGPIPRDPLAALVDWVENGQAPETLEASAVDAEGDLVSRDLCAWPGKLKYVGISDPKRASSWDCVGGTERPEVEYESAENAYGRAEEILGGLKDKLQGLGLGLSIG